MDKIINLKYAKRGSGATTMDGAVRAKIVGNIETKVSRPGGSEVPNRSHKTGAAPQIIIETENFADVILAMAGTLDSQTLVLGYADGIANGRKLTCKFCTATQVGDSEFPPKEGGGDVPRYQITFDLHQGTNVTTLALAIVDAADSA